MIYRLSGAEPYGKLVHSVDLYVPRRHCSWYYRPRHTILQKFYESTSGLGFPADSRNTSLLGDMQGTLGPLDL